MFSSHRCHAILPWLFISLLSYGFSNLSTITINANETDRLALLSIKSQLHDPLGVTSSWNNSVPLCQWTGVSCGPRHQRVIGLNLRNQSIGGPLSPFIGNLSFLRSIQLQENKFYGEIPHEVGLLSRLENLRLSNNSFSGTIPTNLSHCSNLISFIANYNNLEGEIPAELGNLLKLQTLSISVNQLTGQLPASIGNISSLQVIYLVENRLGGRIPDTFGQLKSLTYLNLGANNFFGIVPPSIYNITSLDSIVLAFNQFNGTLPSDIGYSLPFLKRFVIGLNNFTGSLPISITNASNLEDFTVSSNYFSGKVSINFSGLKNLSWLNLGDNFMGNGEANNLEFMNSLVNCSKLEKLSFHRNQFGGMLPNSIANLSTTLDYIYIAFNQISGNIHPGIGNLVKLNALRMQFNQLTGTIPYVIGKLKNLQALDLSENSLQGSIPTSIGNLTGLTSLLLDSNNLKGNIPSNLGNCQNLILLSLSQNNLNGTLPQQILDVVTLSLGLNLSDNLLSGSFPSDVGKLKNLISLDISGNHFSREIPVTLGGCTSLEYLSLQGNSFSGSIPPLISLRSIKRLDFSSNNLSGQIPKYLENLSFLEYLNLSYNHFEGEVPAGGVFSNVTEISLVGNDNLCGGLAELHLPSCHSKGSEKSKINLLKVVIPVLVSFFILSSCFIIIFTRRKKFSHKTSIMLHMEEPFPMISYAQLSKATNEFSSSNMIGEGSYGLVYKGLLAENGLLVAVKVINLQRKGASKSFIAECEALRNVRHRNLIKIMTICSSIDFKGNDFKALVYEYMQHGSLEEWLHRNKDQQKTTNLSLIQRLNIAIDVASAIEYLHHHCQPPMVHGDLKPSNVLLDHDLVAHVGDFGLAKFLSDHSLGTISGTQSSSIGIKGTIGYVAPEYGMGSEVSISGDVYSLGILLLEMFTGRRPTDNVFNDSLNLHDFVKTASPERATEIVEPSLLLDVRADNNEIENFARLRGEGRLRTEGCLVGVLRIGVLCSVEPSAERMEMTDVVVKLCAVRENFLGRRIVDVGPNARLSS
ncbi:hypothetical protein ACOSP7_025099 [Xanthoceras sorbifolium]